MRLVIDTNVAIAGLLVAWVTRKLLDAAVEGTIDLDSEDDEVLACALAARADLIVSGDHRLLNVKAYQSIPIVSVAEALSRIELRTLHP